MQSNRSNLSRREFLTTTAGCVAAAGIMGAGCMNQNKGNGKMLAMCGLDCAACPAFTAHKTDDQALRVKTAAEWSKQFGVQMKPEDINCVGCLKTKGPQIGHCAECEIRKCGMSKKVKNCGLCKDYPCDKISNFIAQVPPAKANLEEARGARKM
ncbi:MAG: DUF3795 domain-containing protein [Solirubrobacterales bacterium]